MTARYALSAGFHTVVEGILYADRYGPMLNTSPRSGVVRILGRGGGARMSPLT
jgi:hypothetical protein